MKTNFEFWEAIANAGDHFEENICTRSEGNLFWKRNKNPAIFQLNNELNIKHIRDIEGVVPIKNIDVSIHPDNINITICMEKGKKVKNLFTLDLERLIRIYAEIESRNIIYADIKSTNIVRINNLVYVIDFDLLCPINEEEMLTQSYSSLNGYLHKMKYIKTNNALKESLFAFGMLIAFAFNVNIDLSLEKTSNSYLATKISKSPVYLNNINTISRQIKNQKWSGICDGLLLGKYESFAQLNLEVNNITFPTKILLKPVSYKLSDICLNYFRSWIRTNINSSTPIKNILVVCLNMYKYCDNDNEYITFLKLMSRQNDVYDNNTCEFLKKHGAIFDLGDVYDVSKKQITFAYLRLLSNGVFEIKNEEKEWSSYVNDMKEFIPTLDLQYIPRSFIIILNESSIIAYKEDYI